MNISSSCVALGGTFEPLHEGHKKLIEVAIKLGGKITIGITSDKMARSRIRSVLPFSIRAENVRQYVIKTYKFEPEIVKIVHPYGKTLEVDFDYLVVSPETYETALENQQEKGRNGQEKDYDSEGGLGFSR